MLLTNESHFTQEINLEWKSYPYLLHTLLSRARVVEGSLYLERRWGVGCLWSVSASCESNESNAAAGVSTDELAEMTKKLVIK